MQVGVFLLMYDYVLFAWCIGVCECVCMCGDVYVCIVYVYVLVYVCMCVGMCRVYIMCVWLRVTAIMDSLVQSELGYRKFELAFTVDTIDWRFVDQPTGSRDPYRFMQ